VILAVGVAIAVGLAVVVLVSGCSAPAPSGTAGSSDPKTNQGSDDRLGTVSTYPPGERRAAPKLTAPLLQGGTYRLRSARGGVVVINFWASWCAPCRAESPDLEKVYRATHRLGVTFVGVDVRDGKDAATAFRRDFAITYPSMFDPAGRVAMSFRDVPPSTIPATVIVERSGRVAAVHRKAVLASKLEPRVRAIAVEGSRAVGSPRPAPEQVRWPEMYTPWG
jgi:thiol-disulfide isomerase/thioredoxin